MIKNYLITYEEPKYYEGYFETTEHQIKIPATCLFDAVNYAHNTLELKNITEVVKL